MLDARYLRLSHKPGWQWQRKSPQSALEPATGFTVPLVGFKGMGYATPMKGSMRNRF
jgi:hypothetical protein